MNYIRDVKIYPYDMASEGAKALAVSIPCLRIQEDSDGHFKKNTIIVNWGNPRNPTFLDSQVKLTGRVLYNWLNYPVSVKKLDRLTVFKAWAANAVSTLPYTADPLQAQLWWHGNETVVCRTVLNGHSGAGIILSSKKENVPVAGAFLYTMYKRKAREYRCHVFKGEVLDIQEKRKKTGWKELDEYSPQICTHLTGWVYCRENIDPPEGIKELAIKALNVLGLDFGAIDIIYSKANNSMYCLEVNTAPGIEGTTVELYKQAILNLI